MSGDPRYIRRAAKKIRRLENGQTAVFQFEDSRVKILKLDGQYYIHPVGDKYDITINGVSIFERTRFTLNDIIGIGDITLYLRNPSKRHKRSNASGTSANNTGAGHGDSPDLSYAGSTEDSTVSQTEDSAADPAGGLSPNAAEEEGGSGSDATVAGEEQGREQPQTPVSNSAAESKNQSQPTDAEGSKRFIKIASVAAVALLLIVVVVATSQRSNKPGENIDLPTTNITGDSQEFEENASEQPPTEVAATEPEESPETQDAEEGNEQPTVPNKLADAQNFFNAYLANEDANGLDKAESALNDLMEKEPQLAESPEVVELQDKINDCKEQIKFDALFNNVKERLATFRQEDAPEILEQARREFDELMEQYPRRVETADVAAFQAILQDAEKLEGVRTYWREFSRTSNFEALQKAETVAEEFNRERSAITQSDEFKELLAQIQQAKTAQEADAKAFDRAISDINNSFRQHKLDRQAALTALHTAHSNDEKRKVKELFDKISEEFDLLSYPGDGGASGEEKTYFLDVNPELRLVWCAPGTFQMGSPQTEQGRNADEVLHTVELTQGFWILKTEVTQGLYNRIMAPVADKELEDFPEPPEFALPITNITWDQAMEFCQKLTERFMPAEYEFTLPTEAQWEYACRAGNQAAYALDKKDIVFNKKKYLEGRDIAQESARQNAWGICDMPGSVYEWCLDQYGAYEIAEAQDALKDPIAFEAENTESRHVIRGGSWQSDKQIECRSAARRQGPTSFTSLGSREKKLSNAVGFRVVITRKRDAQ